MINLDRDYSRLSGTIFNRSTTRQLQVAVVGAGALGNEIIKNLALLGIGRMLIIDSDKVEASNLTRSILFATPDIQQHILSKQPKALLAAKRVQEINPDVKADAFVGEIADLGLGRLRDFDIVFSALDNEMARLELSWACLSLDRLLVDGGLGLRNYSSGLVSVYPGANGPCYACRKSAERRAALLTTMDGFRLPCAHREQEAEANDFVTTTPLMASIVAAMQVEEGIRAATSDGPGSRSEGNSIEITLHPRARLHRFTYARNSACSLHDVADGCYSWERKTTAETTVRDLLNFVEERENAPATLALRWPMVITAYCETCATRWSPRMRAAKFKRHGRCINCGSEKLVEGQPLSHIGPDSEWADKGLRELGLPESHIHQFLVGSDEHVRLMWVEVKD